MDNNFTSLITMLQLAGVIVIFITLAIFIIKVIAYNGKVDKREFLMQSSSQILIGVIIIGSLGLIVSMLFTYLTNLENGMGAVSFSKTNLDVASMIKAENSSSTILGGILGALAKSIAGIITSIFNLSTINSLITPDKAAIFSTEQWTILKGCYVLFSVPAAIVMSIMVFKTGVGFLKGVMNPKEAEQAKEDLMRWFFTVVMIAGGFLFCKGVVAGANFLTNFLNQTLREAMPNLDFTSLINNSSDSLLGGITALYFSWITLKVNVLFIVRDITLAVFIIFTPIAISLWGVNKSINAFGVWLGELISNAFLAFFMSLTFTIFAAILATVTKGDKNPLLFVIVGLSLVLKISSVLRNSLQNWMTRMSGLNEEDTARKFSMGAMLGSALGVAGDVKGATKAGKFLFDGGKKIVSGGVNGVANGFNAVSDGSLKGDNIIDTVSKGVDNTKEAIGSKVNGFANALGKDGFGNVGSKTNNNKLASNAKDIHNKVLENARNRGEGFDPITLAGKDKKGNDQLLNNTAIKSDFLENVAKESEENPNVSPLENIANATNKSVDKISDVIKNDEGYIKENMPENIKNDETAKDKWIRGEAERTLNASVFGDTRKDKLGDGPIKSSNLAGNLKTMATNPTRASERILGNAQQENTDYNITKNTKGGQSTLSKSTGKSTVNSPITSQVDLSTPSNTESTSSVGSKAPVNTSNGVNTDQVSDTTGKSTNPADYTPTNLDKVSTQKESNSHSFDVGEDFK